MNFETLKLIVLSFGTSISLFFTLSFTYTHWLNPTAPSADKTSSKMSQAATDNYNARQSYAS